MVVSPYLSASSTILIFWRN